MSTNDQRFALYPALGWMALFTLMWALIERLGLGFDTPVALTQVIVMRYAAHLCLLLIFCLLVGNIRVYRTQQLGLQLARGACMFLMPASFIFITTAAGVRNLWSVFWCMPLLVLLLARVFLGEKVTTVMWLVCLTGYIGAMLIMGTQFAHFDAATLWPALGGLSFAVYVVITRHIRHEPVTTSLFYTALVAFVCMLPLGVMDWQPLAGGGEIARAVFVGAVGLILLLALDRALHRSESSFLAPLMYGALVAEVLLETLRSGSMPAAHEFYGALVLLGVAVAVSVIGTLSGKTRG